MKLKAITGIILALLLTNMLTVAFNVPPIVANTGTAELSGGSSTIEEADGGNPSNPTDSQESFLGEGFNRDASAKEDPNPCSVDEDRWNFNRTNDWVDFAKVDGDSAELVIGVNNGKPNSYANTMSLIGENGGDLVGTVSMGGEIRAVVANIPLVAISSFVTEVRAAGLSRYVEPNTKFQACFVPNDPYWSYQWGPRIIEADYAWNTTIGDHTVLVAVVDTGIDWDHPDLAANYVALGYDWVNDDTDPMDDRGHGTHCAGIMAAVINNSIGIAGLAQVQIMAEKGLDQYGEGYEDDLADAIAHAVDQGADILSLSWGSYYPSELIHEALIYAYDHGVLVVAAAGNDATTTKHFPAAFDEVIAVTATDQYDNPASWTNFGDWVELAAPGVSIYSTVWNDDYTYMSGTSMSTPHVAGVAALVWSQFPNVTRDWLRLQLRFTADDLGEPGFDYYYGYGRINARRAVEQAPPDHDLVIFDWERPRFVEPGALAIVNTTVFNFGTSNETNITVQLLVNGSIVDSVAIDFLETATSETVNCSWTPTVEATYNVTSYVLPVPGETLTANNVITAMVRVCYVTVALISDQSQLLAITPILDSMGIVYDIYNDNNIYLYTENLGLLLSYQTVIFYTDYRHISSDEYSALESYLSSGGNLLVTGFDSLVSDSLLRDIIRSATMGDNVGEPDLYVVDETHAIMNGPYGSFPLGYHISGLYSDCDAVEADIARNAITVAELWDGYDRIIATEGLPGKVVYWNGRGDYDWTWNVDCEAMLKNMLVWFIPHEHELTVTLDTPPYIEPGDSSLLNVTVYNRGLSNETDVELYLLINGTIVTNVTIHELVCDSSYTLDYLWTPIGEEVMYNVTGYVVPVQNETVTENNLAWAYVYVGFPVKAFVLDSAGTYRFDVISTWEVLNTKWYVYGSTMIYIDYTTLDKDDITYDDIAATGADVLIISCASDPWMGWEFTDSEIEAIKRYVREGHGLIATAGTLYYQVPNNNKLASLFGLNETISWYTTNTDLLHLQDPSHPLFVNVPNPYTAPQVMTARPSDGRWDWNELAGGTYVALGHYEESAIVVYRGLVYISPWLEIIPSYYHHHLQLLYNAIIWSRYQKPEHELIVSLEAPPALKPGESALLNATVSNMGLSNETYVELQLLINGGVVNSTIIPELWAGDSYTFSHLWIPTIEGIYNVTAYAVPVPGEDDTSNNVKSVSVLVSALVVALFENEVPWDYPSNEEALDLYGIPYVVFSSSDFGSVDLSAFSKVVIASDQDQTFYNALNTYRWWFEDYVSNGGVLEIHAADWGWHGGEWIGTLPGGLQWVGYYGQYVTIVDPTHPVLLAPNPITEAELDGWNYAVHGYFSAYPVDSRIAIIEDSTGMPAYLEFGYGAGFIVASSQTLEWAYMRGYSRILENSLLYVPMRHEHDLAVILEAPAFLEPGESSLLNATVTNRGLSNETDVELFLLINGTAVNSTTISELLTGASYTINYLWTPTAEATYNVTAYAPPVPGENVTANNVFSVYVVVSFMPRILTYVQYTDYDQEYANALGAIDSTFGPNYLLTELWDYTQLDFMLPGNDILFVPEQEYTSLLTMEMIGASWSTTLSNFMVEGGIIIVCDYSGGSYGILTGAGLMSISGVNYITGSTVYLVDPSDPLAEGVFNTFIAPNGALSFITDEVNVVFNDGTYPVVIHKIIGPGQIALIGFDYFASNPDADRILGNAVGLWIRYEHDIAASLEAPTFLEPCESSSLNATVHNRGLSNETDVELQLLINGSIVDSVVISELLTGSSYTLSHIWTPTVEATYNVTAYAPPVPGENVTANNIVTKMVNVRPVKGYILFDQTHGTDSISYYSIWAANLIDRGYVIEIHTTGPITPDVLAGYDVFVIPQAHDYYSSDELSAIEDLVLEGGGLLVIGDDEPYIYTELTSFAGITWDWDGSGGYTSDITPHPVTEGVSTAYFSSPVSMLNVISPAIDLIRDPYGYIMLAASETGSGKVLGIADENSISDGYIYYADNFQLANNMIDWLVAVRPEHDLAVSLRAPLSLPLGRSTILRATVFNIGSSNETDIELQLLINGSVKASVVIPQLLIDSSYMLNYLWTPTAEGTYNVTAYAPPVPGETVTTNNVAMKDIPVFTIIGTYVSVDPMESTVMPGEVFTINITVGDIENLYAWQIILHYDTTVLSCTGAWLPEGHVFAGQTFIEAGPVITEDYVAYGCTLIGSPPAVTLFNGTGVLCSINFTGLALGSSALHFDPEATYPMGCCPPYKMPFVALDGFAEVVERPLVVHDVAIIDVIPSATQAYAGWTVNITVTAKNEGEANETFDVTAYYDNIPIGTQTIHDLAPGTNVTLTFSWNTTGVTPCTNYTIWAEASVVPGEIDTADNTLIDGQVKINMLGDVNGDGKVDMMDISLACYAFASYPGHLRWNLIYDLDGNGIVDMMDIAIICFNFGKCI